MTHPKEGSPAEEWQPIPGYGGRYSVSDQGRVHSTPRLRSRGGILRQQLIGSRDCMYPAVGLYANGNQRMIAVHKLVALAFLGPCPPGLEVCHRDGNRLNAALANLRYGTHSENELDKVRQRRAGAPPPIG